MKLLIVHFEELCNLSPKQQVVVTETLKIPEKKQKTTKIKS